VHGDGEHNNVGRQQFINQHIGQGQRRGLLRRALLRSGRKPADECFIDVGWRILGQVSDRDVRIRVTLGKLINDGLGDFCEKDSDPLGLLWMYRMFFMGFVLFQLCMVHM